MCHIALRCSFREPIDDVKWGLPHLPSVVVSEESLHVANSAGLGVCSLDSTRKSGSWKCAHQNSRVFAKWVSF